MPSVKMDVQVRHREGEIWRRRGDHSFGKVDNDQRIRNILVHRSGQMGDSLAAAFETINADTRRLLLPDGAP